jgi:hypothetical protein
MPDIVTEACALVVQVVEGAVAGAEVGQRALQVFGRFAQGLGR